MKDTRGKTIKYTHEEYCNILKEITDNNIVCEEKYINANTPIMHYCKKHNKHFPAKPSKFTRKNNPQHGCEKCGLEAISNYKRKKDMQFKKDLYDKYGDEYVPLDEYVTSTTKMRFIHNIKNNVHLCWSTPNSLLRGESCGVCANKQIWVGYNDITTLRPDVAELMVNKEDLYNYAVWSPHKTDFKCPNCNNIIPKKIAYVSRDGLSCPYCSDGISYPNKFIYNALSQIKDQLDFLEREFSPSWCKFKYKNSYKTGTYDIYFGINGTKYIIEMDGGLGHGNKVMDNEISQEDSVYIDKQKDMLAIQHDIKIIRINCFYNRDDRYTYILNNVLNSELSSIIDLTKINFDECNKISLSSLLVETCNLWNEGYKVSEIALKLKIHETTITNYLKQGSKFNICKNYSAKESKCRSCANEVFCITTNRKFRSITDAAKEYNLDPGGISKCCRRIATHGGHLNGIPLIWIYYKDYILMSDDEIKNYVPMDNGNYTKVVCLNNNYLFNMMKDAAMWCGQNKSSGILACCKGRYKTSGKYPDTGEPLKWMYYSDYIKLYNKDDLEEWIG